MALKIPAKTYLGLPMQQEGENDPFGVGPPTPTNSGPPSPTPSRAPGAILPRKSGAGAGSFPGGGANSPVNAPEEGQIVPLNAPEEGQIVPYSAAWFQAVYGLTLEEATLAASYWAKVESKRIARDQTGRPIQDVNGRTFSIADPTNAANIGRSGTKAPVTSKPPHDFSQYIDMGVLTDQQAALAQRIYDADPDLSVNDAIKEAQEIAPEEEVEEEVVPESVQKTKTWLAESGDTYQAEFVYERDAEGNMTETMVPNSWRLIKRAEPNKSRQIITVRQRDAQGNISERQVLVTIDEDTSAVTQEPITDWVMTDPADVTLPIVKYETQTSVDDNGDTWNQNVITTLDPKTGQELSRVNSGTAWRSARGNEPITAYQQAQLDLQKQTAADEAAYRAGLLDIQGGELRLRILQATDEAADRAAQAAERAAILRANPRNLALLQAIERGEVPDVTQPYKRGQLPDWSGFGGYRAPFDLADTAQKLRAGGLQVMGLPTAFATVPQGTQLAGFTMPRETKVPAWLAKLPVGSTLGQMGRQALSQFPVNVSPLTTEQIAGLTIPTSQQWSNMTPWGQEGYASNLSKFGIPATPDWVQSQADYNKFFWTSIAAGGTPVPSPGFGQSAPVNLTAASKFPFAEVGASRSRRRFPF